MHTYTLFINRTSYEPRFKDGYVTVMWTASSLENTEPNHFVLLVPYRLSTGLTYTCAQSPPEIFECPADNAKDVEPDAGPETTSHSFLI